MNPDLNAMTMTRINFSRIICIIASAILIYVSKIMAAEYTISGIWLTAKKDAKVQIYEQSGIFKGKIIWSSYTINPATGKPYTDIKNPDNSKKDRPILGLIIVDSLYQQSDNVYTGGTVYDPITGKLWNCRVLQSSFDKIKFTGYWKTPFFGRTEIWTRVQ